MCDGGLALIRRLARPVSQSGASGGGGGGGGGGSISRATAGGRPQPTLTPTPTPLESIWSAVNYVGGKSAFLGRAAARGQHGDGGAPAHANSPAGAGSARQRGLALFPRACVAGPLPPRLMAGRCDGALNPGRHPRARPACAMGPISAAAARCLRARCICTPRAARGLSGEEASLPRGQRRRAVATPGQAQGQPWPRSRQATNENKLSKQRLRWRGRTAKGERSRDKSPAGDWLAPPRRSARPH
ncbi:ESX-1 secretion-associated protein EspB-like [Schistocerca nitens]|uniref:ESX-1 secretion-associated protein EspB-like n=1 Tax=Schistocerca nitens TaxID=7011 RepID=UPI0021181091|nr:ESX-1 secretion-associated protein EspB-like [Schistocerca nitens]